jgi:hypothetical protein
MFQVSGLWSWEEMNFRGEEIGLIINFAHIKTHGEGFGSIFSCVVAVRFEESEKENGFTAEARSSRRGHAEG